MSEDNKIEETLTDELRAQMKEEVAALSPAKRKAYGELIAKADAPPAPNYASMSQGEFEAMKSKLIK